MAALIIGEIDNIYNPNDEKVIGAVLSDRQVFAINDETREMILWQDPPARMFDV